MDPLCYIEKWYASLLVFKFEIWDVNYYLPQSKGNDVLGSVCQSIFVSVSLSKGWSLLVWGFCLCCQGAYADTIADTVDRLLIQKCKTDPFLLEIKRW